MIRLVLLSVIFIIMAINVATIIAQPYCPLNYNPNGWSNRTNYFEFYPYELGAVVSFQFKETGSTIEVIVDWSTFSNSSAYGITDEEFKEMMYKSIMVSILGGGSSCHFQGTRNFIFYEETECKVLRHCYLHLIKTQEVYCQDDGWPGPAPSIYEYNNEKYYKLSDYQVCGTQCCKFEFTVECFNELYIRIISQSKSPYPGSQCPAGNYYDCLTNQPENCSSTCE
jgi:hypothetical protein